MFERETFIISLHRHFVELFYLVELTLTRLSRYWALEQFARFKNRRPLKKFKTVVDRETTTTDDHQC